MTSHNFAVGDLVRCVEPYNWVGHLENTIMKITAIDGAYITADCAAGFMKGAFYDRFEELSVYASPAAPNPIQAIKVSEEALTEQLSVYASTLLGEDVKVTNFYYDRTAWELEIEYPS